MCHQQMQKLANICDPEVGSGLMSPENSWEAGKCCRKHHRENFPLAFITFWVKLSIKFENKPFNQFRDIQFIFQAEKLKKKFFSKLCCKLTHKNFFDNALIRHIYGIFPSKISVITEIGRIQGETMLAKLHMTAVLSI